MLSFLMGAGWHAWSTQNSKYAVSLKYLIKELSYEVDVYMLINMKVFYKLIVLFLMGLTRHAYVTQVKFQSLCDILRKKSRIKLGA